MATLPKVSVDQKIEYPCSDGKPVAETPTHRDILLQTIDLLRRHLADDPASYVSDNMLMYYVPGNNTEARLARHLRRPGDHRSRPTPRLLPDLGRRPGAGHGDRGHVEFDAQGGPED